MAKLKFIVFCVLMSSFKLFAQEKFTISGTLRDKASGEELIGATVVVKEIPNTGKAANEYGFYSITLPKGSYTLKGTYIGYEEMTKTVNLDKNLKIDWELESGKMLEAVVIKATKEDDNITKTSMGTEKLDIKEIAKLPVIFGEKDVLKTIQLLPGVKTAGEGNSGFFVRGGAADQNLILLDEAPVYNASHLLGFFSTFNSDAIKDATIIKGNSPANFGGRLSSVLDVRMREGNDKAFQTSGGIGVISSRLAIEGPIQKEKSSFMISGRRTYADVFLKASPDFSDTQLYFYDLNAKANYRINENNRVYVSGYFGRDRLGFGDAFGIDWGNKTGTLRWNSIINSKWFSNTSLIYSDYSYEFKVSGGDNSFVNQSKIKDWNLKQEFQFFPSTKNSWRFGFNSIRHTITPGSLINETNANENDIKEGRNALENAVYVQNTYSVSPKFSMDYGLRLSSWSILGGTTYNIYDRGVKTDSVVLADGAFGKTYFNVEPRLAFNFILNEKSSLKAGYARNTQNLHLLSNSTSSNPTDQWVGSSYNIKPGISDQVSLGYFRNFAENKYEFSAETYYKSLQNQIDYKNGADIQTAPDVESELLYGKGRAYGLELLLKKKSGKFTGWVSYTLSKTERQIDGINEGNWYSARQDRTHDLAIVGMYQLSTRWSLSGNFIFYTGDAVTFPSGKYEVAGNTAFYYTERNASRMPNYHRLDVSATYENPRKGRYQTSWNFSLYNAYGRQNAYTINFEDDENDPSRTRAVQTSLFRWVPSVTYNFKF
ncbi:TonB-dependent receptor [Runella slithyformis]|uniref:TonB-dependent receptor plug n=1 Tax=Runella slithyformis (strain ATCC 29530 / DSM 19594 / LMG 11500 / NCIMB 11436 / LSU 4) TaxID=761193 RepID=A0A7U3ZRU4_RUNSL|nr:TonB-dependent receptor [Runella slithyformis]AEI52205.1 TonB-dependent receptor plug [Runella slithyformis DSM 19594]